MADTTEKPADEMRRALEALREDANGTAAGRLNIRLAFALAALLEDVIDDIEAEGGIVQSATGSHALAVARALNGTTERSTS